MDLIERLLNAARGEDGLASNVPNALIREAAAALEALRAELDEQCRLHAIGMERELKLINERDRLLKEALVLNERAERLKEALRPFVGATLTITGQVIGLMREDFDNARAALDQEYRND